MISATAATAIISIFLAIFGIVLPVVERLPRFGKVVSLRWAVVVTLLAILLGCVLDFGHLDATARHMIIIGVIVICGLYVVLRSAEKWLANGWSLGLSRLHVEKGDLKGDILLGDKKNDPQNPS